jgi:hypothetical protein
MTACLRPLTKPDWQKRTRAVRLIPILLAVAVLVACSMPAASPPREQGEEPNRAASAETGTSPGQRAPDFQVTSLDGQSLTNSQVSGGKPYVLYYFATW